MRKVPLIAGLGIGAVLVIALIRPTGYVAISLLITTPFFAFMVICFSQFAMAPAAVASLKIALHRIHQGRGFDRKAVRSAAWAFHSNRDLRDLAAFDEPALVPSDLVQRIEAALPRLEISAKRRLQFISVVMFICMVIGAVCRFVGSIHHN